MLGSTNFLFWFNLRSISVFRSVHILWPENFHQLIGPLTPHPASLEWTRGAESASRVGWTPWTHASRSPLPWNFLLVPWGILDPPCSKRPWGRRGILPSSGFFFPCWINFWSRTDSPGCVMRGVEWDLVGEGENWSLTFFVFQVRGQVSW